MDDSKNPCIHDLFERQAERTPEAIAVKFGKRELSYASLNARANALARDLRSRGVGPDRLVGVSLERSLEMVVAVLAVLKAGGAYVPFDPSYPKERLDFMMQDSGISTFLVQEDLLDRIPSKGCELIHLNKDQPAHEDPANPAKVASSENLAYVLYTSGSTGLPKGVAMTHGPLCNLISWQISTSSCSEGSRTLQYASLGFDVSFQEIFSTWCSGGTLVLVSAAVQRDPILLLEYLNSESVERLFLPFVGLQLLAETADELELIPRNLREVITAGEQLRITTQVVRLFQKCEGCKLENQYGPTESHVVTAFTLTGPPDSWPPMPPIGRPIPNVHIFILDESLHPVPPGSIGQIYIGGSCLARGYHNRKELTEERFIANPMGGGGCTRLYKTGDLGTFNENRQIEFFGRIDHQVKIHGIRVETGEIEIALLRHPDVADAVVVAREDDQKLKVLVAYVVPVAERCPSMHELRQFLGNTLPEHMVPSAFVALPKFPLTPSGKLDRSALPSPSVTGLPSRRKFVAERNPLELQLTKLWERILGVSPIGIKESFFELGGSSLLAARLVVEIRKTTGETIPLEAIFGAPTIEKLAELIRKKGWSTPWSFLVPLKPGGSKRPFFWLLGQESDGVLPRYVDPDQPLYGLVHQGQGGTRFLYTSVEEIAARYLNEIRQVQSKGPYLLGGYCFGGMVALKMAQRLIEEGEETSFLLLLDPDPECVPGFADRNVSRSDSFLERWHRIQTVLRPMPIPSKVCFFKDKALAYLRTRLARTASDFNVKIKRAICHGYFLLHRPLPFGLRVFYTLWIYRKATDRYVPRPYPGRVMLVRAGEGRDPREEVDWSRLATGGVELDTVSAAGHSDILSEPHAGTWAKLLANRLRMVQTSISETGRRPTTEATTPLISEERV